MKSTPWHKRVALLTLSVICFEVSLTQAQAPADSLNLAAVAEQTQPTVTSALEFLKRLSSASNNVVVNSFTLGELKPLILPEMQNLIGSGSMQFEAAPASNFEIPRIGTVLGSTPQALMLTEDGVIAEDAELLPGLPFDQDEASDELTPTRANQILWNSYATQWSFGLWRYYFALFLPLQGHAESVLNGALQRVYPKTTAPSDKRAQLFREIISFNKPDFLDTYAWLTFRFFGHEQDLVWVYSPALKSVRELTSSNRGDSLLKTSISPDDFQVWSGNPALVQVTSITEVEHLAPVAAFALIPAGKECYAIEVMRESPSGAWNYQNNRFPQAAPWLPSTLRWVPRKLFKLELASKDPFALYGRQVLYIDRATMLPIFKVVYDRAGRKWKVVFGAVGFAQSVDKKTARVFNPFTVSIDLIRNTTYVLDFSKVESCQSYPQDLKLAAFDPAKLKPVEEKKEEAGNPKETAPTAAAELDTDD